MSGRIEGFAPCADAESRLLILGSFPSVKSRAEGFYYGNPHNRFWKTVCAFFGEEVPADVAGKRGFLARRHIALWDVVLSCEIQGSADASIRDEELADVAGLIAGSKIRAVFCNGKLAYKLLTERAAPIAVPALCLPSTSPANPRFDAAVWQNALQGVFGGRS